MKYDYAMLPIIILVLCTLSFHLTHGALSCYSCMNCGTTWDASKSTIVQTKSNNDYCRKIVAGVNVIRDFSSICTSLNAFGNGFFCCQSDLCNGANKRSIPFSIMLIWFIHYCFFYI